MNMRSLDVVRPQLGRWQPRPVALRPPLATIWWLHPGRVMAFLILPFYLTFPAFDFARVGVPAYLPGFDFAWGAFLLVAFAIAATLSARDRDRGRVVKLPQRVEIPNWVFATLLALTIVAYAIWFYPVLTESDIMALLVSSERVSLRGVISTQPGITTFTQCGVAYAVVCAIKRPLTRRSLTSWQFVGLMVVFVLATVRVFIWSERLAMIEMVVTCFVAFAAFKRPRKANRPFISALPVVVPFIVYLLFTGTEYFRSWEYYRDQYDSIWAFSFDRILTYYATATNNGIGLLVETTDWPQYTGRFVLEWLYLAPGIGDFLKDSFGNAFLSLQRFFELFAREEFNNPSGIFPIVFDIGYFGSALYFLGAGAVVGVAYRSYARGRLYGLLLYPSCFLFILELLRFNYFSSSRLIPILGGLALVGFSARLAPWLRRTRKASSSGLRPTGYSWKT